MEMNRKAVATAHRNLSSRIERYLFEMKKVGRPPCRREGEFLQNALACLAAEAFAERERGMMCADVATGSLEPMKSPKLSPWRICGTG